MKKSLKKIINLAKTKTAKDTYIVFVGNSTAGLIGAILMILISRKLGPSAFGVFSVSFALLTMISKFADFGLNFAMVKDISQSRVKGEQKKIKRIFETVLFSKIIACFIFAFLGWFFSDIISKRLFNSPASASVNRWVILFCFLYVFYDLVRVYFEASKRFLESTLLYIVANCLKLVLVLPIVFFFLTIRNFIFIYLLAPFLAGLIFFPRTGLKFRPKFYPEEFKSLFRFASWMAVSVIFAAIGENLNVFMVSAKLSGFQTGIYSAAEKFILPFYIFAAALATVLTTRASEFLNIGHIKTFIKKIFVLQAGLLIMFIFIFPLASFLPFVLGEEYSASVGVLQILIVASYFRLAITPLNSVFYPLNKSIIFAIDSIIQVVLMFVLNLRFLLPFQARGAAFSMLIANVVIFVSNYVYLYFVLKKEKIFSY